MRPAGQQRVYRKQHQHMIAALSNLAKLSFPGLAADAFDCPWQCEISKVSPPMEHYLRELVLDPHKTFRIAIPLLTVAPFCLIKVGLPVTELL